MYNTGIFSKFCKWEWDLSTGKWDFEKKNGLGNGPGTPPSGPSMNTKCKDASNKENKRFILKTLQNTDVFSKRKGMWHHNLTFSNTLCTASARQFC